MLGFDTLLKWGKTAPGSRANPFPFAAGMIWPERQESRVETYAVVQVGVDLPEEAWLAQASISPRAGGYHPEVAREVMREE